MCSCTGRPGTNHANPTVTTGHMLSSSAPPGRAMRPEDMSKPSGLQEAPQRAVRAAHSAHGRRWCQLGDMHLPYGSQRKLTSLWSKLPHCLPQGPGCWGAAGCPPAQAARLPPHLGALPSYLHLENFYPSINAQPHMPTHIFPIGQDSLCSLLGPHRGPCLSALAWPLPHVRPR